MDIFEGLVTYLNTVTALTTLVGDRIGWTFEHQSSARPFVVMTVITEPREFHMNGFAGVVQGRYQLDAVGDTGLAAKNVAEALRNGLNGYRGLMGSVNVRRCHLVSRFGPDEYGPRDGGAFGRFRVTSDYELTFNESIPSF